MKLTNKEKHWLAGFVDGDGTIAIRHSNPKVISKPFKCKIYSHIRPCIEIGNTDKKIMFYLQKLLDSPIRFVLRRKNYKNYYDHDSVELVKRIYKDDLKIFNYSYDKFVAQ